MGVPVVAPALAGNAEVMDTDGGVLIEPRDDAAAYADALDGLLGDAERRAALGERSRARDARVVHRSRRCAARTRRSTSA